MFLRIKLRALQVQGISCPSKFATERLKLVTLAADLLGTILNSFYDAGRSSE